jgi:phosphoglycerate dehydrogenase-like enzyme
MNIFKFKFKLFLVILVSLNIQNCLAVEATSQAETMLAELSIREASQPISSDPNWHYPKRIVLVSPVSESDMNPETVKSLKLAAGSAELSIIFDAEKDKEKIAIADVFLGRCTGVHTNMNNLRWVQHFSAGVENCIGKDIIKDNNILLSNMKGVYGPGIAEHVVAMIFTFSRGLHQFQKQQFESSWDRSLGSSYPMMEVRGKTLLVVGLGGIGSEIAWRANALGMKVIATRNSSRDKPEYVEYVGFANEISNLAKQADFIVNATPLTSSTRGLFNKEFFDVMKPSSYFINIGRGKSVITEDLVVALKTGKLAGTGLDVVEPEPLPANHVLWQMPNVIITPHISARSDLVMARFWIFVRENLRRYVQGERLLNIVNIKKEY